MAPQPSHNTEQESTENTPLISDAERGEEGERKPSWLARHAVKIMMGLLLAAVIAISIVYGIDHSKPPDRQQSVCVSPECVHAASEILYNLSPVYKTLDPCTDFERLVCAGWDDRHDLRSDQGDVFTGNLMAEASELLLKHILEAPYPSESKHSSFSPAQLLQSLSSVDQDNFNKLQDAYGACMDEKTIRTEGIAPLMKILDQITDTFPVKKSTKESRITSGDSQDIANTVLYLAKFGIYALISSGAGADDKHTDTVVVEVSAPWRIGLPAKDYYKDEGIVKKYEDAISQVLASISSKKSLESLSKSTDQARDLVEFEKKLAAASPNAEDQSDVTKYYNPMSLNDADLLTPQIHLSTIVNGLAPPDFKTDKLIVMSPDYLKSLAEILSKTSREVLQNYFIWKTVQSFASSIEADAIKPYTRFINELQGKDPDSAPERWRTCIGHVDRGLGWILSRFYIEKAFSAKAKEFGDQIVYDIKEMFIEKLKVTTWMDKSVIELAIDKVHKIIQKIGYPLKSPNIMDPPSLSDYYRTVNITTTTFFSNSLSMRSFAVAHIWSALGKPVDPFEFGMTADTVNAYYNPPGNEIVFPAGIMQSPVFYLGAPKYLSYGAFGSVSGHELSHAFDSTGRHYDPSGSYTDWWTPSTVAGFEKRADCFVDQYHNYTVPGLDGTPLHVNGKLTLGENIADAGGVAAAFAAWKKRQVEDPDQGLPGLEHFTNEQLFFVNYANWWCGKSTKETAVSRIYSDPHAPKRWRIIGTMANSRDFRESFQCPDKEPVCELW